MKKLFYITLASIMLSFNYSCSNDSPITNVVNDDNQEYELTIHLSSTDGFELTKASKSSIIKHLFYRIYDIDNNRVAYLENISGDTVISDLKIKVRKGNYQINIIASDNPVDVSIQVLDPSGSYFMNDYALPLTDLKIGNIFQGSQNFVVDNSSINVNVELNRPLGRIKLAIKDLGKAPQEVQSITPMLAYNNLAYPTVSNDTLSPFFILPEHIGLTKNNNILTYYEYWNSIDQASRPIPYSEYIYRTVNMDRNTFSLVNEDNTFDFYLPETTSTSILNTGMITDLSQTTFDLYLIGSKTAETPIGTWWREIPENLAFCTKIVENISIVGNKTILITGNFFGSDQLTLTVNDSWGETIDNEFEQ